MRDKFRKSELDILELWTCNTSTSFEDLWALTPSEFFDTLRRLVSASKGDLSLVDISSVTDKVSKLILSIAWKYNPAQKESIDDFYLLLRKIGVDVVSIYKSSAQRSELFKLILTHFLKSVCRGELSRDVHSWLATCKSQPLVYSDGVPSVIQFVAYLREWHIRFEEAAKLRSCGHSVVFDTGRGSQDPPQASGTADAGTSGSAGRSDLCNGCGKSGHSHSKCLKSDHPDFNRNPKESFWNTPTDKAYSKLGSIKGQKLRVL